MENVPSVSTGQSYKCYINDKEQTTTVSLPVINCTAPAAADLPPITSDTGLKINHRGYASYLAKLQLSSTNLPSRYCRYGI